MIPIFNQFQPSILLNDVDALDIDLIESRLLTGESKTRSNVYYERQCEYKGVCL